MKEYKCDYKSVKWYKKINYMKLFITFAIFFTVFFFFFYLIGKDIDNALGVTFIISFLILIWLVLNNLLENRETIYIIDSNSIKYIKLHNNFDGRFLADYEYKDILDNVNASSIFNNIDKYEGIDCGEIIKILKVHKNVTNVVIHATVKEKIWKSKGLFSYKNISLIEKKSKKKLIITNDYEHYDDICKILSKKI